MSVCLRLVDVVTLPRYGLIAENVYVDDIGSSSVTLIPTL